MGTEIPWYSTRKAAELTYGFYNTSESWTRPATTLKG